MRLLIGPTCAGKSTFLNERKTTSQHASAITVHFAFEIKETSAIPTGADDVVHFNLLRGYRPQFTGPISIHTSPMLADFIAAADEIDVIAAPLPVLLRRASERSLCEPDSEEHAHLRYNVKFWRGTLGSPLLPQIYEQLALHLDQSDKPHTYYCSNGDVHDAFQEMSRWEFPRLASGGDEEICRRGHAVQELKVGKGSYQKDYRGHAAGAARSATLERVLQMPLGGKRLLDIGCAEGAAALSAERMGAKVTGIEPWTKRYDEARSIADALGSSVDLRNAALDDLADPPDSYDVVLALNVIHHQADPFAFVDRAAELAASHLVLEYPGLNDRKFRSTFEYSGELPEDIPLMGLSTAKRDQTFVFNPATLRRYLLDTVQLFGQHELVRSPISDRWLSIFSDKRPGKPRTPRADEAQLFAERAQYTAEIERLKGVIAHMRRSRSWRVTAPFRRVRIPHR